MKRTVLILLSIASTTLHLLAGVKTGEKAPEFEAETAAGEAVSLSDFIGHYVVLEWLNHSCPFVHKHYESGNMQRLQQQFVSEGAVWLSIQSNAKTKPGYLDAKASLAKSESVGAKASYVILDTDGSIGHLYDARCTPQMFLIDPVGSLIYQGAIDSISSVRMEDIEKAENYLLSAWKNHRAGLAVNPASTHPYGCSIKY